MARVLAVCNWIGDGTTDNPYRPEFGGAVLSDYDGGAGDTKASGGLVYVAVRVESLPPTARELGGVFVKEDIPNRDAIAVVTGRVRDYTENKVETRKLIGEAALLEEGR